MIKLGLTGSMATGKSTVAGMFAKRDIPIYDADKGVHDLYEGEAVPVVGAHFPDAIIDGKIDRQALSKLVLGDKEKLAQLEKLVHPLVHQKNACVFGSKQASWRKACDLRDPIIV